MPGPLQTFFEGFQPEFQYNALQSATSEFQRLAEVKGWNTNSQQYRTAQRQFKDALVDQFNFNYGKNENSLTGWQALCEALGVEPIPDSVSQAKKIVKSTHVNLVDLTEGRKNGQNVRTFRSIRALKRYTLKEEKVFPKKRAKGELLKYLLRPIFT